LLGSTQLGTGIENGTRVLGWALGRLPETRALASLLNTRSEGIKDLRHGTCLHDGQKMPLLPRTNYYFIEVGLADRRFGRLLGDVLNLDLHNHPAVYEQIRTPIDRGSARRALPPSETTS
jgi:hypothetical protein